jgi:hypothetical protein
MKEFKEMSLTECIEALRDQTKGDVWGMGHRDIIEITDRIEELTRWIPVSERMPTKADGDMDGRVLVFERQKYTPHKRYTRLVKWDSVDDVDYFYTVTHWQRITPPEEV